MAGPAVTDWGACARGAAVIAEWTAICGLLVACAASTAPRAARIAAARAPISARAGPELPRTGRDLGFAAVTESPQPVSAEQATRDERPLREACGESDAALLAVARRLAEPRTDAQNSLDGDELGDALRAAGAPYVWPRAWLFRGSEGESELAKQRMQRWLSTFSGVGIRRCGVSLVHQVGGRISVGAVVVDALADLDALPTRVRIGQWIELRARLRVPASEAKLVIMSPWGSPHSVPTSLANGQILARFSADQAGVWLVQLLGAVDGGPRPLLEALLFAGIEPTRGSALRTAPGEDTALAIAEPREALYAMLDAARSYARLPPFERDERLERLAQAHAEAMRRVRKTAHDAGDGDLNLRLEQLGLELHAGENVAHAASALLAQRALWASPSHRENLLFPSFDRVGLGLAPDPDGTLWVCQVFASSR